MTEPRYRRAQGVLFRRYADEILLASVDGEDCEGLAGAAAEVWDLLESPRSVTDLVGALTPLYRASPGIIAGDVTALLGALRDRGFVEQTW